MKILLFGLVFSAMSFTGMDVVNVNNNATVNDAIVLSTETAEDEALFCKKEGASGATSSCWFCDCSSLPMPD